MVLFDNCVFAGLVLFTAVSNLDGWKQLRSQHHNSSVQQQRQRSHARCSPNWLSLSDITSNTVQTRRKLSTHVFEQRIYKIFLWATILSGYHTYNFDNITAVNRWSEEDKFYWLKVQLTSRVQKAFQLLAIEAQNDYCAVMEALSTYFEPASHKHYYQAELQMHQKKKTERFCWRFENTDRQDLPWRSGSRAAYS